MSNLKAARSISDNILGKGESPFLKIRSGNEEHTIAAVAAYIP
jgi:hypothetical protein